ncbi:hypothetical protein SDJN03_23974, partial [Cucurbita argyrosperma subsp. sororia]
MTLITSPPPQALTLGSQPFRTFAYTSIPKRPSYLFQQKKLRKTSYTLATDVKTRFVSSCLKDGSVCSLDSCSNSPSEMVKKLYECINEKKLKELSSYMSEDCLIEDSLFDEAFIGKEAALKFFKELTQSMGPDVKFRFRNVYESGASRAGVTWHLGTEITFSFVFLALVLPVVGDRDRGYILVPILCLGLARDEDRDEDYIFILVFAGKDGDYILIPVFGLGLARSGGRDGDYIHILDFGLGLAYGGDRDGDYILIPVLGFGLVHSGDRDGDYILILVFGIGLACSGDRDGDYTIVPVLGLDLAPSGNRDEDFILVHVLGLGLALGGDRDGDYTIVPVLGLDPLVGTGTKISFSSMFLASASLAVETGTEITFSSLFLALASPVVGTGSEITFLSLFFSSASPAVKTRMKIIFSSPCLPLASLVWGQGRRLHSPPCSWPRPHLQWGQGQKLHSYPCSWPPPRLQWGLGRRLHSLWKNTKIPFTKGCTFIHINNEQRTIQKAQIIIEPQVKAGHLILGMMKLVTSLLAQYPAIHKWVMKLSQQRWVRWVAKICVVLYKFFLHSLLRSYLTFIHCGSLMFVFTLKLLRWVKGFFN